MGTTGGTTNIQSNRTIRKPNLLTMERGKLLNDKPLKMNDTSKSKERWYAKIHSKLRRENGSATKCCNPDCKSIPTTRFEWALLKGREYSTDINDYQQMCIYCHRKYDVKEDTGKKLSIINTGTHFHGRDVNVTRISPDGSEKTYTSISDALRDNNLKSHSGILNCFSGVYKTSGGYKWRRNTPRKK